MTVLMMKVLLIIVCHLSIVHSFHARYPSLYSKISYSNNYHNNINNIIKNNFVNRHHHHHHHHQHQSISSISRSGSSDDDVINSSDKYSRVMLQKDLTKMILPVIISLLGYSLDYTSLLPSSSSSLSSSSSSSSSLSVFHRSGLIANADDSNAGTKSDKSFELC
jgi:hypothetical protein